MSMMVYLREAIGAESLGHLEGVTAEIGTGCRGDEIQDWLTRHPDVTQFVILDDDADMAHLLPYLVQTRTREGLTDEQTDEVIKRLSNAEQTRERRSEVTTKEELISKLKIENRRYRAALERISKWFGEFPPTGRTWDDGTAMSYAAAFGSNGERDYMRQVAASALAGRVKASLKMNND